MSEVPYVVVVNLLPQTASLDDKAHVLAQVHERRETMLQSADDAARLVAPGRPGSRVKVWGSWPGIESWLRDRGVQIVEFYSLPGAPPPPPPPPPPSGGPPLNDPPYNIHALYWTDKYADTAPGYCPYRAWTGWSGNGHLHPPLARLVLARSRDFTNQHKGIDLVADEGTPVFAAEAGMVIYAGETNLMGGNVLMIAHGNHWHTLYAHLSAIHIGCGDWVARGQEVALSGKSQTSWAHLHVGVYEGCLAHDPKRWLTVIIP